MNTPKHLVKSFDLEFDQLNKKICTLARACENQLSQAISSLESLNSKLACEVIEKDKTINAFHREIEQTIVGMLAKRQPMAVDLRYLLSAIKISTELERIGDYAANIAKRVTHLSNNPFRDPVELILEMATICQEMLTHAIEAFLALDTKKASDVWDRDQDVDRKFARMMTQIRIKMQENSEAIDDMTQLIFIGRCCERIGDHITNIAEDIIYIATGQNHIESVENC